MRRFLLPLATLVLLSTPLMARDWNRGLSVSFNDGMHDGDAPFDCSRVRVTRDGIALPIVEEDVAVGQLRSLRVRSDRTGGIRVKGGDRYAVKVCKASALGNARDLRIVVNGDEVRAADRSREGTMVYFLVQVPRNSSVRLDASNGPISIDSVEGTIEAVALNGPVSVRDSSGTINVETSNGPISFAGQRGTVKLHATNGPISVKLHGSSWETGSLDARSDNGPLSLKMPKSYGSGVVVLSDGHSPVSCRAAACRDRDRSFGSDDEDRQRRIDLGSGAKAVTLTTVNGPISIKED